MSRLLTYKKILCNSFSLWLCTVLILFIERCLMSQYYLSDDIRSRYSEDIIQLMLKGLLFDIKAASVLTALPFLLGLFSLLNSKTVVAYGRIQALLSTVLLSIVSALAIGNWFYYGVYERQFDVFIFGLAEEDTVAVLKTIWSDFPIIWGLIALAIAVTLFWKCFSQINRYSFSATTTSKATWVAIIMIPILILSIGIRGSFGKFPLRQTSMQISTLPQINKLVPNALISLNWAFAEHRNSNNFIEVTDSDGIELMNRLQNQKADANLNRLFTQTNKNLIVEQHKPNVVFAVMESMSTHLLSLNTPERDLLGELDKHWKEDWVYSRFISEGDGTSDSLHRFFIRSPRLNLSQSAAKNKTFPGNMFKPYLDAGYRIVYITAGNGGWRDFDSFLRHLGVHEIIDENAIKARYPEAQSSTWGVPDEFMFRYAEDELKQAKKNNTPVFVMMLSVTNHPPYQLPKPNPTKDFHLTEQEKQRLSSLATGKELNEIFNTFRYSNDQLGRFISHTKSIAPDTIIAATGDHNMRAISYPAPNEIALGHSVPFYLYVPPTYRSNAEYHPERAGSHKDILPTLYNLSLSEIPYYQTGCNLTAPTVDSSWCGYGYNPEVLITKHGFYNLNNQEFHRWDNQRLQTAEAEISQPPAEDIPFIERGSVYTQFLDWQINRIATTHH
ncbi:LTA synthase family protein [Neisseria sp. P0001.S004]|uniref:LTA synthase family protein n=1 Tax=Neisseria sp. P0001.S005 TaxID=3436649 RepID=UPI003F80B6EC